MTVLTASIPERALMLTEAMASVQAQTHKPVAHLVGVDHHRRGAPAIYNGLARSVRTGWMTFLDDDDLLDTDHLETLVANSDDADIVYSACHLEGEHTFLNYGLPFTPELAKERSIIPITALVRRTLFNKAGGFKDEDGYDFEFWRRCLALGARVRQVTRCTWTYRYHQHNHSHGQLARG